MLLATLLSPAKGLESPVIHKRWIIVTTINYPTDSIRILANMTDWKVSQNHSDFRLLLHQIYAPAAVATALYDCQTISP